MSLDALKLPKHLPSLTHEVVVLLEGVHMTIEHVDTAPHSHELISYHRITKADEIRERIQCASIIIATQCLITADSLGDAPHLKCVITPTAGTNHIDLEECRRRGVKVAKCQGSTSPAAAEHALSMLEYFAARRKTVMLHNDIRTLDVNCKNSWKRQGSIAYKMQTANEHAPYSLGQEVVGIIGYGNIGKRLEVLCKGLGMQVLISERKGASEVRKISNPETGRLYSRVPFGEVISSATVIVLCSTFTEQLRNLIDASELNAMRPEAIIINVSRGGIMNSAAVIQAMREKRISGASIDVFDHEPASTADDSPFLAEDTKDLNLTFSPHAGYFSTKTVLTMKSMVKEHIQNFISGDYANFDV
ncbi:putative D-isomer specific 2-hydroxyacid dehydrogenase NAD-binding domain-containing protein [Seiridium unicorne]|uniref:D-isomer specific 2-hydroxyacid dehydrogenase NAD-binding domain-containing protein n=1 Tax=Seiridium unicorne TaxID=138068 RepID=A0ABR2UG67_9PEZI